MAAPPERGLRVAVTGPHGRLGAAVCRRLRGRHQVHEISRAEVDLSDPAAVAASLSRLPFDVLVNTAAFTAVDECERQRELAYDINAHAAGAMAEACREKGARMIQVSTDFVFDGHEPGLRVESDATNPINVYGQSKLLGEAKVLSACPGAIVTRVSWVFGPDKPGFPEWLIGEVSARREVGVPSDKVACPTFSEDYARLVEPLLTSAVPDGGVLHLCNAGATSWHGYAERIVALLREMGSEVAVRELTPVRSAEVQNFVAPRPLHTAMSVEAYEGLTGISVPRWEDAVERYLRARKG